MKIERGENICHAQGSREVAAFCLGKHLDDGDADVVRLFLERSYFLFGDHPHYCIADFASAISLSYVDAGSAALARALPTQKRCTPARARSMMFFSETP